MSSCSRATSTFPRGEWLHVPRSSFNGSLARRSLKRSTHFLKQSGVRHEWCRTRPSLPSQTAYRAALPHLRISERFSIVVSCLYYRRCSSIIFLQLKPRISRTSVHFLFCGPTLEEAKIHRNSPNARRAPSLRAPTSCSLRPTAAAVVSFGWRCRFKRRT